MVLLPCANGAASSETPAEKRPRTAAACVQELKDLKALLDAGLLTDDEFQRLKQQLLVEC